MDETMDEIRHEAQRRNDVTYEKPTPEMVKLEMDRILAEQRERQILRPSTQDRENLMEKHRRQKEQADSRIEKAAASTGHRKSSIERNNR